MKIIKSTIAAVLATTLVACASSPTPELEKNITISKQACCTEFSEFSWIPLEGDEVDFLIDQSSPVGNFAEGSSYFASFVIPDNVARLQVELISLMKENSVFAPKVVLLDPGFNPVESIVLDEFEVQLPDLFHRTSFRHRFVIDREKTPYFIVYSPMEYRKGSTQIPHPERVRAEELGLARPMVTDPVFQHSKFGALELDLKPLSLRSYRAEAIRKQPGDVPVAEPKATEAASVTMLAETEEFYNQKIEEAVSNNEIRRALQLTEEAKRAGSTTAEELLVELLKK